MITTEQIEAEIAETERLLQQSNPVSLQQSLSRNGSADRSVSNDSRGEFGAQRQFTEPESNLRNNYAASLLESRGQQQSFAMSTEERDNLVHRLLQQQVMKTASTTQREPTTLGQHSSVPTHGATAPDTTRPFADATVDTNQVGMQDADGRKQVRFVDEVIDGGKLAESIRLGTSGFGTGFNGNFTADSLGQSASSTSQFGHQASHPLQTRQLNGDANGATGDDYWHNIMQQTHHFGGSSAYRPANEFAEHSALDGKQRHGQFQPAQADIYGPGDGNDGRHAAENVEPFTREAKPGDGATDTSDQHPPTWSSRRQGQQHQSETKPSKASAAASSTTTNESRRQRTPFSGHRAVASRRRRTVDQLAQVRLPLHKCEMILIV